MNIFELLDLIRKNDSDGEYFLIADSIMDLYITERISCKTVLQMYGEIVHIMITNTSPYAHHPRGI